MALASLAGDTVVATAATETWEVAGRELARLLGRGDPDRTKLAERRLAETHEQIAGAAGIDAESIRSELAAPWVTRLADRLEEDPGVEDDLRALIEEIQAAPPDGGPAAGHQVATRRDINASADRGGPAEQVARRDVMPSPPGRAGRGVQPARPGV